MAYNLTALDAANTTIGVIQEVNAQSNDWWGNLFILGLFILIAVYVTGKTGEGIKGITTAAFISSIVAVLFRAADLVSETVTFICITVLVISVVVLYLGGTPK